MSKFTYWPGHKPAFEALREQEERELRAQDQRELRDRFAMAALTGELASQDVSGDATWPTSKAQALARRCYAFADAMMEAREGKAHE